MLFEKEFKTQELILKEIRQIGYTGSNSTFYKFLSKLTEKGNTKVVERFETPPGHRAQFVSRAGNIIKRNPRFLEFCGHYSKASCLLGKKN